MAEPGAADAALLDVTVVACLGPRSAREWVLRLPAGATVRDALLETGITGGGATAAAEGESALAESGPAPARVGIWGRAAGLDTVLSPNDRVEVYRPLLVDPKVARRERFARQGARGTGLFARKRPGGKSGY